MRDSGSFSTQNQSLSQTEEQKQKLLDVVHDDTDTERTVDKKQNKCNKKICCWFICGIMLAIFAIQLPFLPHFINKKTRQDIIDAFVFTEPDLDNSHYRQWTTNSDPSTSVPIIFSIQLFNVTNPDEVLTGAMPKLNLTPPMVYMEYYHRNNISFSANGEFVNHTFHTEYIFNEELSGLDPNTKLTVMSPLIGTLWHEWNVKKSIEKLAMKEIMKIFEHDPNLMFWRDKKASDLVWDIYHFNRAGFSFKWGFMRNESNQYYTLHTGHNDPSRMGEVQRWCRDPLPMTCLMNDSTQYILNWNPPLSISPGHLFYEGVYVLEDLKDKNDLPPLWIDILFRNIYLVYNGTYDFKGIELYKYGIQFDPQLLNTSEYPPNAQFNQFGPSGILNASAAYDGVSIFLSMVLFFGAPDYMQNNSKLGIADPGPMDFPYIDIEPKTGGVFHANASMQMCTPIHSLPNINNVKVEPNKPNLFNLTDDMMIPMYLVTFSDTITDSIANDYKSNIGLSSTLHTLSVVVGWISVVLVLIWSFVTVYLYSLYYHGYKMGNIN